MTMAADEHKSTALSAATLIAEHLGIEPTKETIQAIAESSEPIGPGKVKYEHTLENGEREGVIVFSAKEYIQYLFDVTEAGLTAQTSYGGFSFSEDGIRIFSTSGELICTINDSQGAFKILDWDENGIVFAYPSLPNVPFRFERSTTCSFKIRSLDKVAVFWNLILNIEVHEYIDAFVRDNVLQIKTKEGVVTLNPIILLRNNDDSYNDGIRTSWSIKAKRHIGSLVLLQVATTIESSEEVIIDPTTTFTPPSGIYGSFLILRINDAIFGPPYSNAQTAYVQATGENVTTFGLEDNYSLDNTFSATQAVFSFDTSGIPDNATVTAASLNLYIRGKYSQTGSGTLYCDWRTNDNLNYNESDWKYPMSGNAASIGYSSIPAPNQTLSLALSNPGDYVSKTGNTKLQLFFMIPNPSAFNYVEISTIGDSNQSRWPKLVVTYNMPPVTGSASLSCVGSLTASGIIMKPAAATLTAIATTTQSGSMVLLGSSSLGATGTCVASGIKMHRGASSLTGVATVSANGTVGRIVYGSASLSGVANITASATVMRLGTSALTSIGTITSSGTCIFSGVSSLIGTASISSTGVIQQSGAAVLTALATVTAYGGLVIGVSGTVQILAQARVVAVGKTVFELRTKNPVIATPILPRYPNSQEELLGWARMLSSALESAMRSIVSREQRAITVGTLAQRPVATGSQVFYWAVDANGGQGALYFDDGTWRQV